MRPFFADVVLAVFDLAMIVDLIQQPVAAPGIGVDSGAFLYVGQGRGNQAPLSRRAAQLENASSFLRLEPHQVVCKD